MGVRGGTGGEEGGGGEEAEEARSALVNLLKLFSRSLPTYHKPNTVLPESLKRILRASKLQERREVKELKREKESQSAFTFFHLQLGLGC